MNSEGKPLPVIRVEPLAYLVELQAFLRKSDPEVWDWLAKQRTSAKYAEDLRFELLKSTYRVERGSQPELYAAAEEVKAMLALDAPLTIYQSQNPEGLNASLAYVAGEIHVVLHGAIATHLSPLELRGLFGHELGHYLLWSLDGGKYLTASEMLQALITDAHAHPAHFASWRLFRLYTEIFCDRVAWRVTNELAAVVSMLVKVQTGVSDVDAAAYLRQAEEIFARGEIATQDLTHPEAFIRARSVQLWAEQHARVEQSITGMIGGKPGMDELDLLEQTRVSQLTRRVIDSLLCHKWMQTDAVLAHARLFFEDYSPPAELLIDVELPTALRLEPDSVRDYYCYVLLDFVTVDRELDEPPLAVMLTLAEQWNMKPRLLELLRQELKLRKNQLEKLDKNKVQLLAEANRLAVQP